MIRDYLQLWCFRYRMWCDRLWRWCVLCRDKLQPQSKPTLRDLQSKLNTNPVTSPSPILAFSSEPANLLNSQHNTEAPALCTGPDSTPQDEISLANITVPLEAIKPSENRTCICYGCLISFFLPPSFTHHHFSSAAQVACCLWRFSTNTACVSCCTLHVILLRLGPTFWWSSSPCCRPLPCPSPTSTFRLPSPRYTVPV